MDGKHKTSTIIIINRPEQVNKLLNKKRKNQTKSLTHTKKHDIHYYMNTTNRVEQAIETLKERYKSHRKVAENLGMAYSTYNVWRWNVAKMPKRDKIFVILASEKEILPRV